MKYIFVLSAKWEFLCVLLCILAKVNIMFTWALFSTIDLIIRITGQIRKIAL